MSINLVTYANQTVTPTNDAIIYERAIDQNGIFHGCNVTVSGNNVNITGGYGIVCGREFVIESESIPVTLAPSGTNDGRLYVRLDLADADAPIQLLTAQGNPLPPLEQDNDVNYINGAYEMELATFTVGVSALSDCVETFETIVGSKGWLPYDVSTLSINKGTAGQNWCRKRNGLVEFYVECSAISWSSGWNTIATLPNGFKPYSYYDFMGKDNTNDTACSCKVSAMGEVQVYKTNVISNNVRVHNLHFAAEV